MNLKSMFAIAAVLIGLSILTACQNQNSILGKGYITGIELICIQRCAEAVDRPFQKREFSDQASWVEFRNAIENANEIDGILNYGVDFEMTIHLSDQSMQQFHLSLGRDLGLNGLLVALSNNHQGFSIDSDDADKLRKIIWGE